MRADLRRKPHFLSAVPLYEAELLLARARDTPELVEHLAQGRDRPARTRVPQPAGGTADADRAVTQEG